MRNGNKKKALNQITLIILGICIILISNIETHALYNNPEQKNENILEINAATLLISHDPIWIDGNIELEAFCAGNGTDGLSWETAFKIENYSITSGEDSGILINNTDKFLIINNCTIENFWNSYHGSTYSGIEIQNCSNIKITKCSLTNNTLGVYLDSSFDNILNQNNCSYNEWGFTLLNSENNTLFNNTASYNEHDGFRICGGRYNNISTNVANLNYKNGIDFDSYYPSMQSLYSYGNSIVNNSVEQNLYDGIQIGRSDTNSLLSNTILNNGITGIELDSSSRNTISFNVINGSGHAGIEIEDESNWNLISKNTISSNNHGIIIGDSGYNTIGENLIINHIFIGILIYYEEEYQSEHNIHGNIFENNGQNISYDQYNQFNPPYFLYIGIPVSFIGIIAIFIINRKKINKRWKKYIAEREIKKTERKIKRAKRSEKKSSKSLKNIGRNKDQIIPKISRQDLYISLKIIGWIFVIFIMGVIIYAMIADGDPLYIFINIPILIVLFLLNRKKITMRWKKSISERKIRKNEQKIDISKRIEEKSSKSSKIKKKERKIERAKKFEKKSKSSKKLIKNMNRKDSKLIKRILYKIFKVFVALCIISLLIGLIDMTFEYETPWILLDVPIVIIMWLIYSKKSKYFFDNLRSNFFIRRGQKRAKKAINYAKTHIYKRSRYYWLSSERNYRRALKKVPDFHKMDILEKKIISIKQNTLATYLSEGIVLSKIAWFQFQENHFSQAKKQYSKSISTIELVLKSIEAENVFSEEEEFPITASLIVEILQFLEKNLNQIKNKEKNKKKSKGFIKSSDIQEISEKIVKSIKEMNESLWIYCQSLDSHENLLDLDGLSKILEDKLAKSEKMLNSAQEQMQYLLYYMQSSNKKYERNGFETKKIAMNINPTLEQERIENIHLKIIREYEYIGGKIRLKVGIVNRSDNVLTNLALRFDLPDSLKWIIHEPNLKRRGDTIHIARLGGNEKIAISLYLEPINCLESMINATLTYFDSKDQPQAVIMSPKKVSISCPIFFTREEANIARVKKIQLKLKYEDHKIFPLVKSDKSELIFNKILGSIGKHDVKLVQKEYSHDDNKGEAYFYGVTKVKKDKMIIHLILDSSHQIIEISVNGDEQEPITGLLAELESEIRDKLLVHNIIEDSDKFHDINTSILLGNCPFCNGPISQTSITFFKKGETITCKYCDTALTPY